MLSRNEIASRVLPSIVASRQWRGTTIDNSFNDDYNHSDFKAMNNKNIIKKAILRNRNINLYLPSMLFSKPKEILSSFEKERLRKINQTEVKESLLNLNQIGNNLIESNATQKRTQIINECQSKDYLAIKAKFNAVHDRLKHFKSEVPKPKEGRQPFNLKELTRKVKMITKSVNLNIKSKEDISLRYRLHHIANKKDSRSVEELLRLEKNLENIYLQKVILNIEYDNVFNERKKVKHNTLKKNQTATYPIVIKHNEPQPDANTELNNGLYHIELPPTNPKSTNTRTTRTLLSPKSQRNKKRAKEEKVSLTEMNKRTRNSFRFDQQYFLDKYERCLSNIINEEKSHKDMMVYTSNEINQIIKSKKDIVLDGLKCEYVNKFNENVELEKKIEQKGTEMFKKIEQKHKEQQKKRIEKKVNQAFVYSEEGNLNSMRFQIKDYLRDCDFNFNYK